METGDLLPSDDATRPPRFQAPAPSPASDRNDRDRAAVDRLRDELRLLEGNIAQRERLLEVRRAKTDTESVASLANGGLTPDQWRHRGRGTPAESVETVLWAGASGEIGSMIESIELGEESARLAAALFSRLPQDIQGRYPSPESIIASMIIDDIPLTNAKLLSTSPKNEQTAETSLIFASNLDPAKFVKLRFQKQANGEWKLLVPPSAIANYANELGISIAL